MTSIIPWLRVRQSALLSVLLVSMLTCTATQANQTDIEAGKKLFEVTCAACHGHNLEGGVGFNLKDELWVHGDRAQDIMANIRTGFSKAGMPAFAEVYSKQQIKQITDYILSQREGFKNLTYKLYQIDNVKKINFNVINKLKPIKVGSMPKDLLDFDFVELDNFIIEVEGDLYTPKTQDTQLFAMLSKQQKFDFFIDGKAAESTAKEWMMHTWQLKRGQQKVRMLYTSAGHRNKNQKNFKFFVSNSARTQKLFAVSSAGKKMLSNSSIPLKADNSIIVQRKKIVDLNSYSVAVGFPEKLNYAFNTRNCAIEGIWSGEMLNVGPNVEDRGKDGGIILGAWAFHSPQHIQQQSEQTCHFIKYNLMAEPSFNYRIGENEYQLQVIATSPHHLALNYRLIHGTVAKPLNFSLPESKNISYHTQHGVVQGNIFTVANEYIKHFTLTVQVGG